LTGIAPAPTAQPLPTILSLGSSVIAASNWPLHSTFPIWTGRSNRIAGTQGKTESMSARHLWSMDWFSRTWVAETPCPFGRSALSAV